MVVTALGFTQILGYGTSFYLLAVLAAPITSDTGWSLAEVAAGVSIGLLAGGLSAPWIGRFVDRFGGRPVLACGSICFALGLAGIGLSPNLPSYWLAWCVVGLGMASGLYDAAFSALGRWYRHEARPLITTVTLWGGFASTLLWPLSAYLVENAGWRWTCLIYAAIHFVVALPLHALLMPSNGSAVPQAPAEAREAYPVVHRRLLFVLISASMMLSSIIVTLISVHLIPVLQGFGYTSAAAVAIGALIGPSQVAGRFAEFAIGKRVHPLWTTLAAGLMMGVGTAMLALSATLAAIAIVVYAVGAGVSYIVRGTLPLVLFGSDGYATLMGRLVVPSLIAQALAPWAAALSLEHWDKGIFFPTLVVLALANIVVVAVMLKSR
ncbi:MFS transporter [Pseudorhodoplanes sp.]|uniref:MFS transporter n=1 Tax=Pseudorhodoplanes sp. TaxID=1934341 RepID=UPI003D14876E